MRHSNITSDSFQLPISSSSDYLPKGILDRYKKPGANRSEVENDTLATDLRATQWVVKHKAQRPQIFSSLECIESATSRRLKGKCVVIWYNQYKWFWSSSTTPKGVSPRSSQLDSSISAANCPQEVFPILCHRQSLTLLLKPGNCGYFARMFALDAFTHDAILRGFGEPDSSHWTSCPKVFCRSR